MDEPYRPVLPPKEGYVERDGEYYPTEATKERLAWESDYDAFLEGLMEGYNHG